MTARPAAFFDIDRTLISQSATLALAPAFRRAGLITNRQLLRSLYWHLAYRARGATLADLERAAHRGFAAMRGWRPDVVSEIVTAELAPTLLPLAYAQGLERVRRHRAEGRVLIAISGSLAEIVEPLATALGLDGAIGSRAEVGVDGRFTGRPALVCFGNAKVRSVELAADRLDLDLRASAAYTDSHTDVPLLERVGEPHAVNPDAALERLAAERGWPVLQFS
jgi:HAD superfamily hydrolase (TIGR01490 family)